MLNKPPGCITATRDFENRPTVYDHIPPHFPRLPHVGRLDFNTEGLLLFTDDGILAQALLNKAFAGYANADKLMPIKKVYHVKVKALVGDDDEVLHQLQEPLFYPEDGYTTDPASVRVVEQRRKTTWIEVIIHEGRHHQVRRLCERSGLQIRKLRRVQLGPLLLGDLRLRWCRPLTYDEVKLLYKQALPENPLPDYEPIEDTAEAYHQARQ